MSGVNLPDPAIARNLAEVVQVLVQLERRSGRHWISEVVRIEGYRPGRNEYEFAAM